MNSRERWASCGGLSVMRSAPIDRNCTICAVLARNVGSSIRHPSDDCATSRANRANVRGYKEAPVIGRGFLLSLARHHVTDSGGFGSVWLSGGNALPHLQIDDDTNADGAEPNSRHQACRCDAAHRDHDQAWQLDRAESPKNQCAPPHRASAPRTSRESHNP